MGRLIGWVVVIVFPETAVAGSKLNDWPAPV